MRIASLSACLALLVVPACKKPEPAPTNTAPEAMTAAAPATSQQSADLRADALRLPTLGAVPVPSDNPMSEAKVSLGQQLFFDKRLSADGSRSCYSCHLNEDGTGGHDPIAIGAKNKKLTRHSPVLYNVGFLPKLYWDGRSNTLEEQALAAWAGGNMGVGKENLDSKAKEIAKIPSYKKAFAAVFPGEGVTPQTIVRAISAFERTLVCDGTQYDKYAAGDKTALNSAQKEGLEIFMGKGGCVACHAPPHFSTAYLVKDGAFFNTGMGTKDKKEEEIDPGRMAASKAEADWAAFKPPTLRNVSRSVPYFHDGSVSELAAAVRFMASGGYGNKNKSPLMTDKKLSDTEVQRIVAFLEALDCPKPIPEPKAL